VPLYNSERFILQGEAKAHMEVNTGSRSNQTTTSFPRTRGPAVKDTFLINKRIRRKIVDYSKNFCNRMNEVVVLEGVK